MTNLDATEMRAELNAKEADLRRSIERLTAPALAVHSRCAALDKHSGGTGWVGAPGESLAVADAVGHA